MPKLLELQNSDGSSTLVAVSLPGEDVLAVSKVSDKALEAIEKVGVGFDKILASVVGMGASLQTAIKDTSVQQATIEVGVQFSAKGTIYVVESEALAAVKVTLTVVP